MRSIARNLLQIGFEVVMDWGPRYEAARPARSGWADHRRYRKSANAEGGRFEVAAPRNTFDASRILIEKVVYKLARHRKGTEASPVPDESQHVVSPLFGSISRRVQSPLMTCRPPDTCTYGRASLITLRANYAAPG